MTEKLAQLLFSARGVWYSICTPYINSTISIDFIAINKIYTIFASLNKCLSPCNPMKTDLHFLKMRRQTTKEEEIFPSNCCCCCRGFSRM